MNRDNNKYIAKFRHHSLTWVLGSVLSATFGMFSQAQEHSPSTDTHQKSAIIKNSSRELVFETGPVRPLAMSIDGNTLYRTNLSNHSLDVYDISDSGPRFSHRIATGLSPVAVAVHPNGLIWVSNHLSDSVSIIDPQQRRIVKTLLVGDEPRDIVFAGKNSERAFIATAHRGQHRSHPSLAKVKGAGDPELTREGRGRADVWIFNVDQLGTGLGGTPEKILTLFGDTPRALAVTPDKKTVYAAIFHSGNKTSIIHEQLVCSDYSGCRIGGAIRSPGGMPGPATNAEGHKAPHVGVIVRYDTKKKRWLDADGRNWSRLVRFSLPDQDVFAIDANKLKIKDSYSGVGTTLFNMAVNPSSGALYVSNTESNNFTRFEGSGKHAGSTVQGNIARARVSLIENNDVTVLPLNSHIDYSQLAHNTNIDLDVDVKPHTLAIPTAMNFSADGDTLYLAAFGSDKVAVLANRDLSEGKHQPRQASNNYIDVSGGGPSGIAVDSNRDLLYVSTRFDNGLSVIDLKSRQEIQHLSPAPAETKQIQQGRHLLYNAQLSSSNGEASCASCHVFGHLDHLSWDLGDPDGEVTRNPIPIENPLASLFAPAPINGSGKVREFHPMKGPMATQSLRGITTSGAMHWRGDRANGALGIDAYDEKLSFMNFKPAFNGLLGRKDPIDEEQLEQLADFALAQLPAPNPVRGLDNQLTASQARGRELFFSLVVDGPRTCNDCHLLAPAQGLFGTNKLATFDGNSQIFKVAHLRGLYEKVGMFGMMTARGEGYRNTGNQIRGFGFSHDGSVDTLFRFTSGRVFQFPSKQSKLDVEQFLLAFDTDLAPITGQQITLTNNSSDDVHQRVDLLISRAMTPFASKILPENSKECELMVSASSNQQSRQWLMQSNGLFRPDHDKTESAWINVEEIKALPETIGPLTFTCVVPGWGHRLALDHDNDGILNGDETSVEF